MGVGPKGCPMRTEFTRKVKALAFQRANGECEICTARLMPGKFRYDHRLPDALGGEPTLENCVVQCIACDKPKTADDVRRIRKADRQRAAHIGAKVSARPMPGSRRSGWKKKIDGSVVPR